MDMHPMIRYRVAELLEEKGWTVYRLAKEMNVTRPAVYRLADPKRAVTRIDGTTLSKLCEVFSDALRRDVQPGELLEWVPDKKRGR
jgi:DNA-binding Xre family transcriptional regulator